MPEYPVEELNIKKTVTARNGYTYTTTEAEDDGTMPASLERVSEAVVGHRIVAVEQYGARWSPGLVITLDDGTRARVKGVEDCCAYTQVEEFLLHADKIDHIITGVGTTDLYTTWHFYADAGDVLEMKVAWSCGNPFYYGYGFQVEVETL